mgnify:CR=1 FL=1
MNNPHVLNGGVSVTEVVIISPPIVTTIVTPIRGDVTSTIGMSTLSVSTIPVLSDKIISTMECWNNFTCTKFWGYSWL